MSLERESGLSGTPTIRGRKEEREQETSVCSPSINPTELSRRSDMQAHNWTLGPKKLRELLLPGD